LISLTELSAIIWLEKSGVCATEYIWLGHLHLNEPTFEHWTSAGLYHEVAIKYDKGESLYPLYYFKSTTSATVESGVVTHSCGTSTSPRGCSASSVTNLM